MSCMHSIITPSSQGPPLLPAFGPTSPWPLLCQRSLLSRPNLPVLLKCYQEAVYTQVQSLVLGCRKSGQSSRKRLPYVTIRCRSVLRCGPSRESHAACCHEIQQAHQLLQTSMCGEHWHRLLHHVCAYWAGHQCDSLPPGDQEEALLELRHRGLHCAAGSLCKQRQVSYMALNLISMCPVDTAVGNRTQMLCKHCQLQEHRLRRRQGSGCRQSLGFCATLCETWLQCVSHAHPSFGLYSLYRTS